MIRKIVTAAVIGGASLSFVAAAHAQTDFNATPMNTGAPNMTPTAQPEAPAAQPTGAPMKHHRMHHHMMKNHMMKKKTMKKAM